MECKLFSIHDIKAHTYSPPFVRLHKGEALRYFSDLVQDTRMPINKHPEDYMLYMLGSMDDVSGEIRSLKVPECMGNATDFLDLNKDKKN